jgi:signal transduction histidine kinase
VAVVTALSGSPHLVPELVSCLNGLFWFAAILGFGVRYLRRQGVTLDRLTEERLAAQGQRAAEHARYNARIAHYRALHDTVLSTLSAIARGGLDHRATQVRDRCGQAADYIRRLVSTAEPDGAPGPLGDQLGQVVNDAEALGLRVHYRLDPLPLPVPDRVAEALSGAAREALNNVAKHAGTRGAWLTATSTGRGVLVRVVDRGAGFAADARPGFGLPVSVIQRMDEVGGAARVTSAPGDGACVELVWPA